MKNKHTPLQATTPFPLETIRSFLGMSEPSMDPTTQDLLPSYPSRYLKAENPPTGSSRIRYRQAVIAYDGKIPFNTWLESADATIEKVQLIYSLLIEGGVSTKIYLNKLGASPPDIKRGEMLACINLILFEEKFILTGSRAINEYLAKILYRYKVWSYLVNKFYNKFYHLLNNQNNSIEFLTSYLITMLERLGMVDREDPYWQSHDLNQKVSEIVVFYRSLNPESHEFVRDHLPTSISIFRKKRPVNYKLLHILWIKHKIYSSSKHRLAFNKILIWLIDYKSNYGITVLIESGFSKELYMDLSRMPKSASNRLLEGLIKVS